MRVVDDVWLEIRRGEALGLVGESGSGKSTLARTILRLLPASAGRVFLDDIDLFALDSRRLRRIRPRVQMIFQDSAGSLNPSLRVEAIVGEALLVHQLVQTRAETRQRVLELLEQVGLSAQHLRRFPHELSGGQKQRVGIARALALRPDLLICDECLSALDVTVQAQILALLGELRQRLGLAYLFIAHNLWVVRGFCDQVAVMRHGRIVERAAARQLFAAPQHPYTRQLLEAAPRLGPRLLATALQQDDGGLRR